MHWILNLISIGITLLIIFNVRILLHLGGSMIFLLVFALIHYLFFRYKKFQVELLLLTLISISLMGINYLAYLEAANVYPYLYVMIGFAISFLVIITCFNAINTRAIKIKSTGKGLTLQEKRAEIFKKVYGRYVLFPFESMIYAVFPGFVFALSQETNELLQQAWIKYLPLGLFWMIVAFIVTIISLKTINKNYILYLISKKERFKILKIRRYFVIGAVVVFLLGTVIEMGRGLWIIWLESYLLFIFIIIASWQIWRYFFEHHRFDSKKVNLKGLKSVWDFDFVFKYVGICILVFAIYLVVLFLIYSK
jgi:hypothetical protein